MKRSRITFTNQIRFGSKPHLSKKKITKLLCIFPVYFCAFDEDNPARNILVMENLRDSGYNWLRPEVCGLVYMRAAMRR